MVYHYTESGLDNVYLQNGFTVHETEYGEGISIHNTEGLHKAIGKWLVQKPHPFVGAEVRFLRVEMELTQRDLAGIIGATEQTLRLWEKQRKKSVPGPADRLLRALYSEFLGNNVRIRTMLEHLADLDRQENERTCFGQGSNKRWRTIDAPTLAA